MLKFFRKIRRKLINESNLKRYLIYAIGEILLVMIGILLALQVNNLNEEKKSRIQANLYKEKIIADLVADTIMINNLIIKSEKAVRSIQSYFDYFDKGGISINALIDSSTNVKWERYRYLPINHTLIDLKSSGKIGLFSEEKRKSLFQLTRQQEYLQSIIDIRVKERNKYISERNKYLDFDPSENNFYEIVQVIQSEDSKIKGLLQQHYVFKELLGIYKIMISFGNSIKESEIKCLELLNENNIMN